MEAYVHTTGSNMNASFIAQNAGGSVSFGIPNAFGYIFYSGIQIAVFNNTGFVIGNSNVGPADMLDVQGAIGLTATTTTLPVNGIYSPAANQLALTTSGATAIMITSTGSVGIGTASPAGQPPCAAGR